MAIIKTCFTSIEDERLSTAAAFFTIFYALTFHYINYAVVDTYGILGSKDIGAENHEIASLRLKQSVYLGIVNFFAFSVIPSFFYSEVLISWIQVDPEYAAVCQNMVIWALPAMFVRLFNDFLKTFLQNYKSSKKLGYSYLILIIVFLPITILVINFFQMGENSVGLILFFFELFGFSISLYLTKDFWGTNSLDFSLSFWNQLGFYLSNFIKNFFIDYPPSLVFEFEYLILTFSVSNSHLIAFSIFSTFGMCFYYICIGFSVEPRTIINRLLGCKMYQEARDILKVFQNFFFWFGMMITIIFFGIVWGFEIFDFFGPEENELRGILSLGKWTLLLKWWAMFRLFGVQTPILKSIGCSNVAIYFFSIPYCWNDITGYLTSIYFGYGALGIFWTETFTYLAISEVLKSYLKEEIFIEQVKRIMDDYEKAGNELKENFEISIDEGVE